MAAHCFLLIFVLATMLCVTMSVPYNAINGEPFRGMNFPTFDYAFAKIDAKAPTPIGFDNIVPILQTGKANGGLPSIVNYAPNADKMEFSDRYPDFFKDLEPSRRFNIPGFMVGSMKFPLNNQDNQYNSLPINFDSDHQPITFDNQGYEQPKLQNNYDNNVQYPPNNINNFRTTLDQGTRAFQGYQDRGSTVPKGPQHQYIGNIKDPVLGPKPGSQSGIVAPAVFATHQPVYPDRYQPNTSIPRRRFPVVLPLVKQEHTNTGIYGEDPSPRHHHLAQPGQTSRNQGAAEPQSKVFKADTSKTEYYLSKDPKPSGLANIPGSNLAFQVVDKPKANTFGYHNPASFENALSAAVKGVDTAPSYNSYHTPPGSYHVPGGSYNNPARSFNIPDSSYSIQDGLYSIPGGSYPNPGGPFTITERKCQVEFFFDFDHKYPFKERYNRIWMGAYGHVYQRNDAVTFNGNGAHLYIPYFAGNDLRPAYYLSLRVFPQPSGSPGQAILSNGFSSGTSTMSLALVGNKVELALLQRETQQVVVMSLPIQMGTFSLVSVEQDGVSVRLTVGVNSVHETAKVPKVSREPLYIGIGASPLGVLDPFTGTIDSLVFHKCPTKLLF